MIVVLKSSSSNEELEKIIAAIKEYGYTAEVVKGKSKTIIGAVGDQKEPSIGQLSTILGLI